MVKIHNQDYSEENYQMNHFEKKNNILELKIEKKVDFLLENLSYEDDNLLSNHRNVHTPAYLHEFVFFMFLFIEESGDLTNKSMCTWCLYSMDNSEIFDWTNIIQSTIAKMAKNIITSFTIQVLLLIDNLMSVEQLPVQTEAYYKSILIPM